MQSKMKHKRITKRDRLINMYASLWHTSECLLDAGNKKLEGSYHQYLASIVFTAFTLEAYLNHIGKKLFTSWDVIDKLPPEAKLKLICEKLALTIKIGNRPWQTVRTLIHVRNSLAHGRTASFKDEVIETYDTEHEPPRPDFLQTEWEAFATQSNAEKTREDVRAILQMIHDASGATEDDYLFCAGSSGLSIKRL